MCFIASFALRFYDAFASGAAFAARAAILGTSTCDLKGADHDGMLELISRDPTGLIARLTFQRPLR